MAVSKPDVEWAVLQYIALGIKVGRGKGSEGDAEKLKRAGEFISEHDVDGLIFDKYIDMTESQFVGYYKEKLAERKTK